ncbi:DUF4190 domain-containing protein [Actinomadura luteofluorescens]|uniref:DUF4190 domain-containing protein n=1 Tax=Actinomadura luteofluorescens TaxID=46163 RepID=A0A7Y9ELC1_9ACTN|nr:DUF4190 domain-containing protein [Actinomadura luteofluorescens]NYD49265.1 hypothetical protein [Actinomadura luteofluorescens]
MTYPPPGPGQPGPQAPYPPPPPPMPGDHGPGSPYGSGAEKTNGLAIAAFVTGLLGCLGVVGLVLGAVALSQISKKGGKGRGLAIAGIVLSCLWIVGGIAAFALSGDGSSGGAGATPKVTQTKPKEVDAKKMKVGDCINDNSGATSTATEEPVEVESVKIVPCAGPHDGEVTAVFRLKGFVMPPEARLQQLASNGCKLRTQARINRDPAARGIANSYYYPTADSWKSGDRVVTCVAVAAADGKKLTRPLHR